MSSWGLWGLSDRTAGIEDSRGPVMYHATSPRHRDSIQQSGLLVNHSEDDPQTIPGIYMSPQPSSSPYSDVWAVDTSKLQHLEPDDPAQMQEFQDVGGSYWTRHDVPVEALRLHQKATQTHKWASTDGIRYAHIVEADVAEDLRRLAMPSRDAYDDMVSDRMRKTDDIPEQGEFYHGSNHEHRPGDILESARVRGDQDRLDYYEKSVGAPNHADWVWMYNHPAPATKYHKNIYQLEPLDEGPWVWNNYRREDGSFSPGGNDEDFPRLVSPRARVIRKLSPEEYAVARSHMDAYYESLRASRFARRVTADHEHVESGQPGRPDWTGCAHPECRPDLPTKMYHVSHPDNRESIARHGLLASYSQDDEESDALGMPHGIYMTSDEPKPSHDTERYPGDVWAIDTTQLKHLENDFPGGMLFRNAYATKYDVPPEAMRLHRPSAHRTASIRLAAVTQDLVNRLHDEFHQWWHNTGQTPHAGADPERGPLGHWPHIEQFLGEHYPMASMGLEMGMEEAGATLDGHPPKYLTNASGEPSYETGPDAVAEHGYDPAEIAAAFVLLHNQSHPLRGDMEQRDQDRLNDIFMKRMQMQRNYEQRTRTAAAFLRLAGFDPREVTRRIGDEFRDWAGQNSHRLRPTAPYGPERDWRNIELFLKDNYPAAHKGLNLGQEEAADILDGRWRGRSYRTGPEAVDKYGYDPKEIAAGALLVHNQSHPFRLDQSADLDRLTRIYDKRQQMQRDYEQRTKTALRKTAADLAKEYTDSLHDEFHDWVASRPRVPAGGWGADNPGDYSKPMGGPLTYWDNIEGFFKDRYPEAYRGFNMAEEKARPLLDNGRATWSAETMKAKPYETGPEAVEKYGYDPKLLAAGMMYLHTWSHAQSAQNAWRGDKLPRDVKRLTDLFEKRQQMQDAYRQRAKTAMPAPPPEGLHFKVHHNPESWSKTDFDYPYTVYNYPVVTAHDPDFMSGIPAIGHLEWFGDSPSDRIHRTGEPGEIAFINVRPQYRRHNVATTMFDWTKNNVEPRLHHSDERTGLGRQWIDHEESRHRTAMAWDQWADKIKGGCLDGCGLRAEGRYTIPQAGAFMDYVHRAINGKPTIHIISVYTHPSDRGSGAAEAMIRRLVEDHPGHLVNPGTMTNDGQKFHDRLLDKDPARRDLLA